MYALIGIPGSQHFRYYGPASKAACEEWLTDTVNKMLLTEQVTATLPRRVVSNLYARSLRYRDNTRVIRGR